MSADQTRGFETNERGAIIEPVRGLHVLVNGRLGECVTHSYDYRAGGSRLVVRYFNGEPWPVAPLAEECQVLLREYDEN